MSEEREVLFQVADPRAGLFPAYESGAAFLKEIVGTFVGDFSIFTDLAIESLASSGFFKTLKEEAQVERGDVQHIVGKFAKIKEITLTNKNILLLYKKGGRSKQSKLIVFPLKYAIEVLIAEGKKRKVKTKEGRIGFEKEAVCVIFQVPQKGQDKLHCFTLSLSVDNPWIWTKAIERVIGLDLTKTKAKEKVCRIVNAAVQGRRMAHVLCFTQKRIVTTRFMQGSLLKKTVLLATLMIPGTIMLSISLLALFLAVFGALGRYWNLARLMTDISYLIVFVPGILLTVVPYFTARFLRRRRYRNLVESVPQNILDTESKSFEVSYSDVTQVKVKKHRLFIGLRGVAKVEITAKNGKHDFKIMKKPQFLTFMQIIQRFLPERKILMDYS